MLFSIFQSFFSKQHSQAEIFLRTRNKKLFYFFLTLIISGWRRDWRWNVHFCSFLLSCDSPKYVRFGPICRRYFERNDWDKSR